MRAHYFKAMDTIHRACIFTAGLAIVIITLIIPYGVFTRFVLNSASSWPEPLAILLMIWLSFLSAIVCYREHLHIAVGILPNSLTGQSRVVLGIIIELAMAATVLFMLWYGAKLCEKTWYQSIAEFPIMSVGVSYLPIPISGLITLLFIIERFLKGNWFPEPHAEDDIAAQTVSSE